MRKNVVKALKNSISKNDKKDDAAQDVDSDQEKKEVTKTKERSILANSGNKHDRQKIEKIALIE